jgi:hypothetical protein
MRFLIEFPPSELALISRPEAWKLGHSAGHRPRHSPHFDLLKQCSKTCRVPSPGAEKIYAASISWLVCLALSTQRLGEINPVPDGGASCSVFPLCSHSANGRMGRIVVQGRAPGTGGARSVGARWQLDGRACGFRYFGVPLAQCADRTAAGSTSHSQIGRMTADGDQSQSPMASRFITQLPTTMVCGADTLFH